MVRCLSGKSRAQPLESACSNRESIVAGSRNLAFAAASSRAKGSPASLRQIEATALAFSAVSSKVGEASLARSTKRRPEAEFETSSIAGDLVEAGKVKGGTGYSCSPLTRNGAQLVTSTQRSGHTSISSATSGAASNTC